MATGRDRTKHYMTRGEWYVDPDDMAGTNGQGLGHTISGFEIDFGEQVIEDTDDEDGANINQVYFAGNQVRLRSVLKSWDPLVLAQLFPNHFDATDLRIQIPGTRNVGDSMLDESVVLVFVPDNPLVKGGGGSGKDPGVIAFKAIPIKPAGDQVPFRNTELRKVTVEFLCVEDKSITTGDRALYRTIGIGPTDELSVT